MDAQEFYASLPKKRIGAAALFHDEQQNILILNPTYTDHWLFPGGGVEFDESPTQACIREVKEEISLDIAPAHLLCVNYVLRNGVKTEALQFIFDGGILSPEHIQRIVLQDSEIGEYRFVSADKAIPLLSKNLGRILPHCLRALAQRTTCYLENGQPL